MMNSMIIHTILATLAGLAGRSRREPVTYEVTIIPAAGR